MNIDTLFKSLGFSLHYVISQSQLATKLYIRLLSIVLKPIPNLKFKQKIVNSINSIRWPDIYLEPQRVRIGSSTLVKIVPHFYEFDFEAVVSTTLNYEPEVFSYIESRLADYDAIIEIGANVGIYSIFFSSFLYQHGKKSCDVFVFEPSKTAFFRLLQNIKINVANNIQAFNCALGEKIEFLNFFEPEGHLTNGSLRPEFAEIFSNSVQVRKALVVNGKLLENLVEGSEHLLIKIDVEGAECSVLRGLETLINQKKPDLLIEVLPMYQNELNNLEFLFLNNYSFLNITDSGLIRHEKFVASKFRDYILLPPNQQQ